VCDGIDNDCDGKVDTDDEDIIRPTASFCATGGACAGATLECRAPAAGCGDTTVAWRCVYGAGAEVDSCGNLLTQETRCDGVDGDCDNVPDDAFANKGQQCGEGTGICRDTGTFQCNAQQSGTECVITAQGGEPQPETCNNLDDNCDGMVDNGATDEMVLINNSFWIDRYEASHPDATATSEGAATHRACSNADVLPWSLVTWDQAKKACEDAGKRLCSQEEWTSACNAGNRVYPYGNTYQPNTCNGKDFDGIAGGADDDVTLRTGQMASCQSQGGIRDLSGNLREWTSTVVQTTLRQIKGGAYDNIAPALTCGFDFWKQPPDSFFYNLGFRCCRNP
jgi:hypothetical protein